MTLRSLARAFAFPAVGFAVLALGVGLTLSSPEADAQGRAKPRPARGRAHKVADGGADAGAPEPIRAAKGDGGAGELVAQKTLDGGQKVFRFGEMEIEGRLKNPQLVFFLRRVRAEFAAGDLGHRSFLRELDETKLDPNF